MKVSGVLFPGERISEKKKANLGPWITDSERYFVRTDFPEPDGKSMIL